MYLFLALSHSWVKRNEERAWGCGPFLLLSANSLCWIDESMKQKSGAEREKKKGAHQQWSGWMNKLINWFVNEETTGAPWRDCCCPFHFIKQKLLFSLISFHSSAFSGSSILFLSLCWLRRFISLGFIPFTRFPQRDGREKGRVSFILL